MTPASTPSDRGRFITIEGPEGAGKTSQAERLEAHLSDDGVSVIRTHEPGGTSLGELLRELLLAGGTGAAPTDPLADALLFSAARRQLVEEVRSEERRVGKECWITCRSRWSPYH